LVIVERSFEIGAAFIKPLSWSFNPVTTTVSTSCVPVDCANAGPMLRTIGVTRIATGHTLVRILFVNRICIPLFQLVDWTMPRAQQRCAAALAVGEESLEERAANRLCRS
jgi:hypothetical protein